MGELAVDTALASEQGRYRARLAEDWEIYGVAGGYLSAVALRAAVAASAFARPASYTCHYLNPASFGDLELEVTSLRRSARAESLRVVARQGDREVLEALAWTVPGTPGVDHDTARMPQVSAPEAYRRVEDLVPAWPPFPFWRNLEYRPVLLPGQDPGVPGPAHLRGWYRFTPASAGADLAVAAGRLAILADVLVFPAAAMAHGTPFPYRATSLDLAVVIHDPGTEADWLFAEAEAPVAGGSLVGGRVAVWSQSGRLLASGVQQMLQLR